MLGIRTVDHRLGLPVRRLAHVGHDPNDGYTVEVIVHGIDAKLLTDGPSFGPEAACKLIAHDRHERLACAVTLGKGATS